MAPIKPNMILDHDPTGEDFDAFMAMCKAQSDDYQPKTMYGPTIKITVVRMNAPDESPCPRWLVIIENADDEHIAQYNLDDAWAVDLSISQNITDVSALGRVHTLVLSGCDGITNASVINELHAITIRMISKATRKMRHADNLHRMRRMIEMTQNRSN